MIRETLRLLLLELEDHLMGDIGKPERIIEAPEPVEVPQPEPVREPVEPEKVPA